MNSLGILRSPLVDSGFSASGNRAEFQRRPGPAKEATMELRMRLNVLAAIISFAFLTAVIFGMF
jgi:hypothetical protein